MNKVFRVIWNAAMHCFVVASELARGKVKSQSTGVSVYSPAQRAVTLSSLAIAVAMAVPATNALAAAIIANGATVKYDAVDIVSTASNAETGRGLSASNNGSITFTNGTLTTSGTAGQGAMANSGATIKLQNTDITTTGGSAPGLLAQNNGSIDGNGVKINTSGASSFGVQANDGLVTLSNSEIISSAYGAVSQGAAGNILLNNTTVNTSGTNGHAVYVSKGGQITVSDSMLATTGRTAAGAYASGAGSTININNSNISTAGSSSEAVYARDGGTINLTNTNIFTDKINAYGLRSYGSGSMVNFDGGTVTTAGQTRSTQATYDGKLNIRNATINSESYAVDIEGGSQVNLDNVIINTRGLGIFATGSQSEVTAKNIQVNNQGDSQVAIMITGKATANIHNADINQSGYGRGIEVLNGSSLTGDNVRINIDSDDDVTRSHGISMGNINGNNQITLSNSQVNLNGANSTGIQFKSTGNSNNTVSLTDSSISATEGNAMMVSSNATASVTTSGSLITGTNLLTAGVGNAGTVSNVELTGDNGSVFNGDVIIDRANTVKNIINLNNNSAWTGATASLENLNISGGSAWNVTGSSQVDNLTLNNASLNMTAPGTGYSNVTLGSLNSTDGTISFKTHLMDDHSETDHLHITGDYTGDSSVRVQNAGGTGAQTIDGIELIRVDGKVNGTFTQQGRIVAGAYDYHLVQNANTWVLESNSSNVSPGEPINPVNPVNPGDQDNGSGSPGNGSGNAGNTGKPVKGFPVTRPEAGSYAANLAAGNTLFTTSLDDRLGETHYTGADGKKHATSLWLRNAGGHTRFSDSSGQLKTTGNRYVMQLGGDLAQWSSNGDDRFHLGVMGGYANAQSNTRSSVTGYSAKGQVHGYSTGVYATWLQDNADKTGAYVDSWMLYNWFDNSVKGEGIAEESYKSKGITASVEAGYAFKVAEMSERSSFYLQPKAQATWMGVKADDHKEHNGTRVVGEGDNNVQTRLGVRAYIKGHNAIDDGKNRTFEPFIEANWVHNTESYGSSMNGVSVQQAGARNLGEVKVGVDAKLNTTVNLWGNIGQQMGDKGYSDTSAMVGVKVNF